MWWRFGLNDVPRGRPRKTRSVHEKFSAEPRDGFVRILLLFVLRLKHTHTQINK